MDNLTKKLPVDPMSNIEITVGLGNVIKTVLTQKDVSIKLYFNSSIISVLYFTLLTYWSLISDFIIILEVNLGVHISHFKMVYFPLYSPKV